MAVDESRRLLLHDAARHAWGAEAALVLMEMLPPTGWADVATKRDLDALEERVETRFVAVQRDLEAFGERIDLRFDAARSDMQSTRWELRAEMAQMQRRTIQWNVASLLAAVAAVSAVVKFG
jgi:hypothetical protein